MRVLFLSYAYSLLQHSAKHAKQTSYIAQCYFYLSLSPSLRIKIKVWSNKKIEERVERKWADIMQRQQE